jgi:hypothetical protein
MHSSSVRPEKTYIYMTNKSSNFMIMFVLESVFVMGKSQKLKKYERH